MKPIFVLIFLFCSLNAFSQSSMNDSNNASTNNDTLPIMKVLAPSYISDPYPVPAVGYVSIDYTNIEEGRFELFDLSGKKLKQIDLKARTGKLVFSSNNFNPGVYIYRISDKNMLLKSGKLSVE